MSEYAPAGNETYENEPSILENPYEQEVQLDIWQHERKKTVIAVGAIGVILLVGNLIAVATLTDNDASVHWLDIILFPVLFFALAVFARLQPMVAAIGSVALVIVITVLGCMAVGALYLISGWIYKVLSLYFIITSFRHAKEAEAAKKKLAEFV